MAKHLQTQLATVQAAIERIESTGQSASIGDMSYTEANVSALYVREERLLKRLAKASGKRPSFSKVKLI